MLQIVFLSQDSFSGNYCRPFKVVVEATASYVWFVELVEPLAEQVVLANPKKLRVIAESTKKTDRLDGRSASATWIGLGLETWTQLVIDSSCVPVSAFRRHQVGPAITFGASPHASAPSSTHLTSYVAMRIGTSFTRTP